MLSGLALLALLACLALIWAGQRRLIYFPLSADVPSITRLLPTATDVSFQTEDGLLLRGWFVPSAANEELATLLVFNGNAGSRADRLALASTFATRGLSVMLFDYRGYGGNPGKPTEAGLLADARAARAFLASHEGVDPDRIVYFGESLGAAVAVALARERPPAALILRSPFTSLVATGKVHYPLLPVGLLLRDRYSSIERIADVRCPLLVVAGDRDLIVPQAQSRALFDRAPSESKRFLSIPGAGHNDPSLASGPEMIGAAMAFVEQHVAARRRAEPPAQEGS